MRTYPEKNQFCQLALNHTIIPVYSDVSMDLETPVSVYYKLVGEGMGYILESAETSKSFGRYSFIGAEPFITVKSRKQQSEVMTGQKTVLLDGPPLAVLKSIIAGFSFPGLAGLPPFSGGAVGYCAFETVGTWERVRGLNIPADMVLGEFLFCRILIVMDHLTHSARLIYLASVGEGREACVEYDTAVERLRQLTDKLRESVAAPAGGMMPYGPADSGQGRQSPGFRPGTDALTERQRFLSMVETAKQYIAAGDVFQAVLSLPFRLKTGKPAFSLYRRLRQINPSPYMFHINFGQRRLVGASPEMLVKLENGNVFAYPIAGTRPRGKNQAEDESLAAELLADEKERAEHAMLVDLARNDLGRISLPGTVKVSRMMQVERFSHVMHLVSEVCGRIDPRFSSFDALSACFPAGTVSGAPKVRALEIINKLEQSTRGAYAGAVGYFDFRGNMDTCITIRTLTIDGNDAVIQTGAGIVADSAPEKEYEEVLNKAKVLFQLLAEEDRS